MAKREERSLRYAAPPWARAAFGVLETVAPPLAVRLAVWKFCNPKRRPPRPEETRILSAAERMELPVGSQRIVAHAWGSGPRILLHHGWSGSGAQMAPLADALARADVVTMEADYTKKPPAIDRAIKALGGVGVPLIAIFPAADPYHPIVFSDAKYTKAQLIEAISQATRQDVSLSSSSSTNKTSLTQAGEGEPRL